MGIKDTFRKKLIPEEYEKRVPLPVMVEPSFESCIEEFIKQYLFQESVNKTSNSKAYRAYRRMFCDQEEDIGNNSLNQQKLMDLARNSGYYPAFQPSSGSFPFVQISKDDIKDEHDWKDMVKIYLNCDRKNIALLATRVFEQICDIAGDDLQMKFVCEQTLDDQKEYEENASIKNYQRNDKIVVYAENQEKAEELALAISKIRETNPELFLTQKKLPFIPKKYRMMGMATKSPAAFINTPLGPINGVTYNEYIANVFQYCIVAGFDEAVGQFEDETKDIDEKMAYYARGYSSLNQNKKAIVLMKIRRIFEEICKANNIKTAYTQNLLEQGKQK